MPGHTSEFHNCILFSKRTNAKERQWVDNDELLKTFENIWGKKWDSRNYILPSGVQRYVIFRGSLN